MTKKQAITIFLIAIVVVTGGYFGYEYLVKEKKEEPLKEKEITDIVEDNEKMIHYTNVVAAEDKTEGWKITISIENNNLVVKGINKNKTNVPKVKGLSGTLKYFTYVMDPYANLKILVLTEEGRAFVGYSGDVINRTGESDYQLNDIEFEQVNSNKKIVDITKKEHKAFVLQESEVLCIKERGEKLKGLFDNHMSGKMEIKVYDEVYPWQQYLKDQETYIYKDGSVQIDMVSGTKEDDFIKKFLIDENNQKIYVKNILIKYTTPDNSDNYRETYIVDKSNRLYYLKNTKLLEAETISVVDDGNHKMKLHSNKKVSKVEVVEPSNPDGSINATIYYEDGTQLVLKDITSSYKLTTNKLIDLNSLMDN